MYSTIAARASAGVAKSAPWTRSFFGVPAVSQHGVLFWGILVALLLRGIMIAVGAALIAWFY
jgi:hypothetical protein